MQIEEQIKTLLRLKTKIDLYRSLKETFDDAGSALASRLSSSTADYPGLADEFKSEIKAYLIKRIDELGNPPATMLAAPIAAQKVAPAKTVAETMPGGSEEPEIRDPIKFLVKYRHLDGKKVTVTTKDGTVQATVRGLAAPHIKVETDTGFYVGVSPSQIKEI